MGNIHEEKYNDKIPGKLLKEYLQIAGVDPRRFALD